MVPYIFLHNQDAISNLVSHAYMTSISEILIKVLSIEELNFNDNLAEVIAKKKIESIN